MSRFERYAPTAVVVAALLWGCAPEAPPPGMESASSYFDNTGRDDVLSGGVKTDPHRDARTAPFRVWTKRVGNNPTIKVLLLHGGPVGDPRVLRGFRLATCPGAGIEYYYYDQLGSYYCDQPDDPELWTIERFVDEVEQVRLALGLDAATSTCWASRGAGSWPSSTRWRTARTSRGSSSPT